jgi:ribonuclease HI
MYNIGMKREDSAGRPLTPVIIYTDGACSGNPGPGGWAAIIRAMDVEKEISGFDPDTTNNRMELTAALKALEFLNRPCSVDLYSDSAYLVSAFNEHWILNWKKRGWKNAAKMPVANQDLWEALWQEHLRHEVRWHKVKGHSDNEYNNRCDKMAVGEILRNT